MPGIFTTCHRRFPVSPGDQFHATIEARTSTSALVTFRHLTRVNQTAFMEEVKGIHLCQKDGGWGVAFMEPKAISQFYGATIVDARAIDTLRHGHDAGDSNLLVNCKPEGGMRILTAVSLRGQVVMISNRSRWG